MIKASLSTIALPVIGISFLIAACGSGSDQSPTPPSPGGTVMVVTGVVVSPVPLENVLRSSGKVMASESVDLAAEASGRVETISFKEGAFVRKGDLLAKINDDDLQAQLRKTELQIQLASEQEERQKLLFESNNISTEQYEISQNQVNTLRADRDNLLAAIRKREVRAPFDGFVGLRYVSEGGYVSPSTRFASIQKINPLKVDFAIPGKYAGQVSVGDTVQFTNADMGLRFTGRLYAIEPRIDPAMGTLQLRALCENTGGKTFPGTFVEAELRLKRITDALIVPTQAVIPVLKGQTVLVRRNGLVASIPVLTGVRTATGVQIIQGIQAGDTVITSGIMQLRPGMPVTVTIK